VGNEDTIAGEFNDLFSNFIEFGRIFHHAIGYSGETTDKFWDSHFGINQTRKFSNDLGAIVFVDSYFSYLRVFWTSSRCFDIDDCVMHA